MTFVVNVFSYICILLYIYFTLTLFYDFCRVYTVSIKAKITEYATEIDIVEIFIFIFTFKRF